MPKVRNLTPHNVTILDTQNNVVKEYPAELPKEQLPRLEEEVTENGTIDRVPLKVKRYKDCINLPEKEPGVYLIVSGLIASTVKRDDLLITNTVRDSNGQIIGCDSFSQSL